MPVGEVQRLSPSHEITEVDSGRAFARRFHLQSNLVAINYQDDDDLFYPIPRVVVASGRAGFDFRHEGQFVADMKLDGDMVLTLDRRDPATTLRFPPVGRRFTRSSDGYTSGALTVLTRRDGVGFTLTIPNAALDTGEFRLPFAFTGLPESSILPMRGTAILLDSRPDLDPELNPLVDKANNGPRILKLGVPAVERGELVYRWSTPPDFVYPLTLDPSLSSTITADADDGWGDTATPSYDNDHSTLTTDVDGNDACYLRFTVTLTDSGATIDSAKLTFEAGADRSADSKTVGIAMQDENAPGQITDGDGTEFQTRWNDLLSTKDTWQPPTVTNGTTYQTGTDGVGGDFAAVFQAHYDVYGTYSSEPVAILMGDVQGSENGTQQWRWDDSKSTTNDPQLDVEWTVSSADQEPALVGGKLVQRGLLQRHLVR